MGLLQKFSKIVGNVDPKAQTSDSGTGAINTDDARIIEEVTEVSSSGGAGNPTPPPKSEAKSSENENVLPESENSDEKTQSAIKELENDLQNSDLLKEGEDIIKKIGGQIK